VKKYKNILFYVIVTASLLFVMYKIVQAGHLLETPKPMQPEANNNSGVIESFGNSISHNISGSLSTLLLGFHDK